MQHFDIGKDEPPQEADEDGYKEAENEEAVDEEAWPVYPGWEYDPNQEMWGRTNTGPLGDLDDEEQFQFSR